MMDTPNPRSQAPDGEPTRSSLAGDRQTPHDAVVTNDKAHRSAKIGGPSNSAGLEPDRSAPADRSFSAEGNSHVFTLPSAPCTRKPGVAVTPRAAPTQPDQTERPSTCRYCGSPNLFAVECTTGPHWARSGCSGCGRFLQWLAKPDDAKSAGEFLMPFGKHRGRKLADLPSDYLQWVAEEVEERSISRRARLVLAARIAEGSRS
jgi:uncharacterized protein (DUF3820 family)